MAVVSIYVYVVCSMSMNIRLVRLLALVLATWYISIIDYDVVIVDRSKGNGVGGVSPFENHILIESSPRPGKLNEDKVHSLAQTAMRLRVAWCPYLVAVSR